MPLIPCGASFLNTKQGSQDVLFGYHFPFAVSARISFAFFFLNGGHSFLKSAIIIPPFPPAHFCENILAHKCMIQRLHFQKDIRP